MIVLFVIGFMVNSYAANKKEFSEQELAIVEKAKLESDNKLKGFKINPTYENSLELIKYYGKWIGSVDYLAKKRDNPSTEQLYFRRTKVHNDCKEFMDSAIRLLLNGQSVGLNYQKIQKMSTKGISECLSGYDSALNKN